MSNTIITDIESALATLEKDAEVGVEDAIAFIKSDAGPFLVAFGKKVSADALATALPIAGNALAEIAAAGLSGNPAVIGGVVTSTLTTLAASEKKVALSDALTALAAAAQALEAPKPAAAVDAAAEPAPVEPEPAAP